MSFRHSNNQIFLTLFVYYIGVIILSVVLVHGFIHLYNILPHHSSIQPALLKGELGTPKPCENFVFQSTSLVIFIVSIIGGTLLGRAFSFDYLARYVEVTLYALMIVATAIMLYAFHAQDFVIDLMNHHGYAFMALSFVLLILIWRYDLSRSALLLHHQKYQQLKRWSWLVLFLLFLLITCAFRLLTIETMTGDYSFSVDVPFYGLSQILAGKVLLVDLPSEYGYFPALLGPILRLFSAHSLFAASLSFTILLFMGFSALFIVLHREIRYLSIAFFTALALLFVHSLSYKWASKIYNDPYYEYNPLRFFWPCISVLLFYFYSKKTSLGRSMAFSLVSGVAMIWNMDTGFPIALSFFIFLLLQSLVLLTDSKRVWSVSRGALLAHSKKMILHIGIISACFGLFFLLTAWAAEGRALHYDWLWKYQKIYYLIGYGMIPMPRSLHPWMLVLAVYLFGILFSQYYSYKGGVRVLLLNLILYLSLLGLGLFVYYTGRSHIDNLFEVMWPAVVIAALWVDRLIRLVHARFISKSLLLLSVPFWILVLVSSVNQLSLIPKLVSSSIVFFKHLDQSEDPQVINELHFIQQYQGDHSECLILAQREGIYYLETGLGNPVPGPAIGEIILQSDRDQLLSYVLYHPVSCIFYGKGIRAMTSLDIPLSDLLGSYKLEAQNSLGTMVLLTPR